MNDAQILDRTIDRYMEEAGQDIHYALRLLAYDYLYACSHVSRGLARVGPVAVSRFSPEAQVEAIDIPAATAPEASTPS